MSRPHLSIVVPAFNEELSIPLLAKALRHVASRLPKAVELLIVDDGSQDGTVAAVSAAQWPWAVRIITLSRNFGHQAALLAGLEAATGERVVSMDCDLQHPPSLIPQLYELSQQGYQVVLTQRIDPPEKISWQKRMTSKWFYTLINWLSDTPVPVNTSDFRLLDRQALNELLAMPEHRKFLRGMVNWIGFKSVIIPFEVGNRSAGQSKYSLQKMLQLAFRGVTSFSVVPLYFSGFFSVVLFGLAFGYALYVLYVRFVTHSVVSGWASVLFVLLILGGFITLFLGLFGFYLAAIFEEVKQRPAYIVKQVTLEKKRISR